MKKSLRYISLILAAVFLIAGCATVAFAEEGDVVVAEPDNQNQGNANQGNQGNQEQPAPDQGNQEPVTPDPGAGAGTDTGNNGTGTDTNTGTGTDSNAGGTVDYNNNNNSNYSDNSQQTYDNSQNYGNYADTSNGNNSNNYVYSDETAGSVSKNNTLYSSSGISAADAAPNTWSDIKLDEKTVKTGVADFSSIKANTETADNGQWILYLGYLLLALSVLGILYFIIASIAQRKAYNTAAARESRAAYSAAPRSQAARMNERERRESASQRSINRYNDEIKAYNRRVSSKADTGEVYVPRRAR